MAETVAAHPAFFSWRSLNVKSLRFVSFLAAIFLYAVYGTPTPDHFGWVEISVALLLMAAAGFWRVSTVLHSSATCASWWRPAQYLLLYGLSIPLLTGLIHGNHFGIILRDVIPFLFLLLPLFYAGMVKRDGRPYLTFLTVAVLLAGLAFALRVLLPLYSWRYGFSWQVAPPADPFYLANAPTVLFTALCLGGAGGYMIYRNASFKSMIVSAGLFILAVIPLIAMALITQRASMGMVLLYTAGLLMTAAIQKPLRLVLPMMALLILIIAGWDGITAIVGSALQKTSAVGLNMRWQEALAVFDLVSQSWGTALFGKGWGATFASPAVGGVTVNFTHNLVTTYWLKTGLCGVALLALYFFHISLLLWRVMARYPVLGLALAAPFLVDIMLYASFKSLDFGLILLLIIVWGESCTTKPSGVLKEEFR